jgi:hypothetical protein
VNSPIRPLPARLRGVAAQHSGPSQHLGRDQSVSPLTKPELPIGKHLKVDWLKLSPIFQEVNQIERLGIEGELLVNVDLLNWDVGSDSHSRVMVTTS